MVSRFKYEYRLHNIPPLVNLTHALAEGFEQVDALFRRGFEERNIETVSQSLSLIRRNFSVLSQVAFVALKTFRK